MTDFYALKQQDPDRAFLSLFIKDRERHQAVVVMDSLNVELARLRDIIDTPHMGLIRLQWWKDEIAKIFQKMTFSPHPLLVEIAEVITITPIEQRLLIELIEAREADFQEYDSFDIYGYARSIHTPLMEIKKRILSEREDVASLAQAYALIGLLRAIPFYKARSQVLMPSIQPEAVKIICDRAEELLSVDKACHRYFRAHHALAQLYLRQLKSNGYRPDTLKPIPFKELRVWWSSRS